MPIPPEKRQRLLTETRQAAAAFVEDMDHIREVLANTNRTPGQIRLLSGVLRRLLVENDLRSIAPPRIGPINFLAPDNEPIYSASRKQNLLLFASGGIIAFGCEFRAIVGLPGKNYVPDSDFDQKRLIPLCIDGFLNQKVFAFDNVWANRRDVIKYVANVASGVHSTDPKSEEDMVLNRGRRHIKISAYHGGIKLEVDHSAVLDPNSTPPFKWSPEAVDFVLIELLAAAHFLAISPDIQKLEVIVRAELA